MRLGLTGAHRSGKTTLAKEVSKNLDVPFIETKVSGIFEELGLDVKGDLSFDERLLVQDAMLIKCNKFWAAHNKFITDRTPLDFIAYMLADISPKTVLTKDQDNAVSKYFMHCMNSLNINFDGIVFVPMLFNIGLTEEEGKAGTSYWNRKHVDSIIRYYMVSQLVHRPVFEIEREVQDLEERIEKVTHIYKHLDAFKHRKHLII